MNNYTTAKITEVIKENYRITSIVVDKKIESKPGQFVMIWIPGVNEKPFGIADDNPLAFSIANVGPFSKKLTSLKKGVLLSFKGPLGTSFSLNAKNPILVGGGYGVVPLYLLAKKLKGKCTVIIGAKTKKDLIYEDCFRELGCKVYVATEDGSKGEKGFATHVFEKLEGKFDKLYSCGPEPMMKALGKIAEKKKIDYEFSLERLMKCGIGICGSCSIGDKLVCKDGPVFTKKELKELKFLD